jgi:putative flippase GtrA
MAEPNPGGSAGNVRGVLRAAVSAQARGQLVRYAIAGATVAVVYVGLTLLLSGPAGLAIQAAIPIAYVTAITVHFTLQRWFVFHDAGAFALAMHHQVGRYLVIGLVQYATTAAATAVLPGVLDLPEKLVYVGAVGVISAVSFVLLRTSVFHPPSE